MSVDRMVTVITRLVVGDECRRRHGISGKYSFLRWTPTIDATKKVSMCMFMWSGVAVQLYTYLIGFMQSSNVRADQTEASDLELSEVINYFTLLTVWSPFLMLCDSGLIVQFKFAHLQRSTSNLHLNSHRWCCLLYVTYLHLIFGINPLNMRKRSFFLVD